MGSRKVKNDGNLMVLVLIGAIAFALFKGEAPVANADYGLDEARAFVAGDMAFSGVDTVLPNPDPQPKPTPGKCPVCNGTGKVGDGRIFVDCGSCGGDGVIESGKSASEIRNSVSVLLDQEKLAQKCQCGPDCKCASDPDNPDCKCPNCKCDPITLPDWKPTKPRKQLRLYRQSGQPLPITDRALEALKAAGWEIGPNGHIDVREAFPERPHGTWELEDGSAAPPLCWIDMTATQIAAFYDMGVAPTPIKSKRWYRVCGPNGCTWVEQ